jgi:RNA methyltransferase, TrmH family
VSPAEPRRGGDGSVHEVEALHHCRFQRFAEGERGSDGGGKRAAGAVQGCRTDPGPGEMPDPRGSHQHIGYAVAGQVASLDQRGTGAEAEQTGTSPFHGGEVVHHSAGQDCGFIQVGRYQRGEGKQILPQYLFGLGGEQAGSRGRYHDRIHHQRGPLVFPNGAGHPADDGRLGQHPGFQGRGRKVFGQRDELGADHRLGDRFDRAHPASILSGQCDDDGRAEDAELLEGLEIRLDPGAASGVGARNGERNLPRICISMTSSLQTMIRDLQRRRGRERRGLALAEGVRLLEEALATDITIRGAAASPALESTTRGKTLKAALEQRGIRVEAVSEAELEKLADTEHPQGVVAVIEPKQWVLEDIRVAPGTVVLALDGVQDPGNVGTMLRSALGLGAAGVVALKGTADLTNPKVIRAAMGASFRLPAVTAAPDELVAWARLQQTELWVADSTGEPVDRLPIRSEGRSPIVLVVGNEGAGVSPSLDLAASRRIAIPLAGGVESLNVAVAAGILLHEVTRGA